MTRGPEGFDYTAFYCEENAWRLLARPGFESACAVLVFGADGAVAVGGQRLGSGPRLSVVWDYHAFVLDKGPEPEILDFDCALGFRLPARDYIEAAFDGLVPRGVLEPLFRCVPAADFVRRFWSDRSHMRAADGSWLRPPPPWASPADAAVDLPAEERLRLADLIDPGSACGGKILDLGEFRAILAES